MAEDWAGMMTVGRIIRPQANRGEVVIEPETDFGADRFAPGSTLYAEREGQVRPLQVVSGRPHHDRWVVGFEGVKTIDEAEALRGLELRIPQGIVRPLAAGQFYVHDLVGCVVSLTDGRKVGTVTQVDLGVGPPRLRVTGDSGEILIPFVEDICRRVDVAGASIVIEPPAGLLELNAPGAGARPR